MGIAHCDSTICARAKTAGLGQDDCDLRGTEARRGGGGGRWRRRRSNPRQGWVGTRRGEWIKHQTQDHGNDVAGGKWQIGVGGWRNTFRVLGVAWQRRLHGHLTWERRTGCDRCGHSNQPQESSGVEEDEGVTTCCAGKQLRWGCDGQLVGR